MAKPLYYKVVQLVTFFFSCLGSVRELLSKVMELRASNWGSGTSEGAVGNYPVYPSDDGYYYSDYPLGMVSSL